VHRNHESGDQYAKASRKHPERLLVILEVRQMSATDWQTGSMLEWKRQRTC